MSNYKKILYEGKETNYSVSDEGEIRNDITNRVLKGTLARNEYHTVQLSIGYQTKTFMVHRLVAEAFCPNSNPKLLTVVHHKDLDKLNNRADNLEWVTTKENNQVENKKQSNVRDIFFVAPETTEWVVIPLNENYEACKEGFIRNRRNKRILQGEVRNGYIRIDLGSKRYSAHRVIYETFKGPIKGVIDHIDGNKLNNHIDNLRDMSQSENMKNAQENGHKGQIKVSQYSMDGQYIQTFNSYTLAGEAMGVSYAAIKSAADRGGTSCGYYWVKEGEQLKMNCKPNKNRTILQYSLDGELLNEYDSYAAAGRAVGVARQNISDAVNKGYKTKGFIWKFKE